jgi:hypothetical protein
LDYRSWHAFELLLITPGEGEARLTRARHSVMSGGEKSAAIHLPLFAAGLSFILGMKIPGVPYQVAQWRREHPGEDIPGRARIHPALARRTVIEAPNYKTDRARRALRGIHEQVAKSAKAVATAGLLHALRPFPLD